MQTKSFAHTGLTRSFVTVLVLLAIVVVMLAATPSVAHASSYRMPQVDITATVEQNGTLHVVERRTFDFDGRFSTIWWTQGSLPRYGSYQVNGVKMGIPQSYPDDPKNPELYPVEEVPFEVLWRTEGGPGKVAYSVDMPETTCYLFFNYMEGEMVAEIDYEISNAIDLYDDTAELYWKYVQSGWAADSQDISCTVVLPAPAGTTATPKKDVYAWGHGSLNGSVSFSDDGTQVLYETPLVQSGEWAEARILFPKEWITSPDERVVQAYAGTRHLDTVLDEEKGWAREANIQRYLHRLLLLGLALATIAPIVWAFVKFWRFGRERTPTETFDYWRDVPEKGVHPAVISRLENWNKEDSSQLTATIMHLAQQGALQINRGSYPVQTTWAGAKEQEDYYLTRNPQYQPTTPIDKQMLHLLFNVVGKGKNQVWLGALSQFAKDHPSNCEGHVKKWHATLGEMVNNEDFFDLKGENAQSVIYAVALVYAGIAFTGLSLGFFPSLVLIIPAALMAVIGRFASRRSQRGADVHEKCRALKQWLTHFSAIDERPPTDVKVWGQFMVFAYVLGVAKKTAAEMRKAIPGVFAQEEARTAMDATYVPFYSYYDRDALGGSSFADALDSSMSAVTSAATPSSDGGGGGGGFSGGGGGGFGGGGGGGAR